MPSLTKPRLIYMGTPDFAVPALNALAAREEIDLALVVTQPDRPAGRGRRLTSPPVKDAALRLDLPVLQVSTFRDPAIRARITELSPDLIIVAAFGLILGRWILDLPRCGCVNLHASLLPHYRGANPIATAILEGETRTGVSLMRMERGLDTGPVYATESLDITDSDTTESLTPRLADLAADLIAAHLDALLADRLTPTPQPDGATLTRPLAKADGWLDWSMSSLQLERQVRALWPWPRAWTSLPDGTAMQIHASRIGPDLDTGSMPGEIHHVGTSTVVACANGTLLLERVQFAGGRPLEGSTMTHHSALTPGTQLGRVNQPSPAPPLLVQVTSEVKLD